MNRAFFLAIGFPKFLGLACLHRDAPKQFGLDSARSMARQHKMPDTWTSTSQPRRRTTPQALFVNGNTLLTLRSLHHNCSIEVSSVVIPNGKLNSGERML